MHAFVLAWDAGAVVRHLVAVNVKYITFKIFFSCKASYLSFGAARLDKDGKVSDLMWDLMQQDGEGGDGANCWTNQERRSHCQAISKIMDEVSCQVQVTWHLDVCVSGENGE